MTLQGLIKSRKQMCYIGRYNFFSKRYIVGSVSEYSDRNILLYEVPSEIAMFVGIFNL